MSSRDPLVSASPPALWLQRHTEMPGFYVAAGVLNLSVFRYHSRHIPIIADLYPRSFISLFYCRSFEVCCGYTAHTSSLWDPGELTTSTVLSPWWGHRAGRAMAEPWQWCLTFTQSWHMSLLITHVVKTCHMQTLLSIAWESRILPRGCFMTD